MNEGGKTNVAKLLEGIRRGQVPRQVRLFAAQGLLPVSREELLRLQAMLSADPDEELAGLARASLEEEEAEALVDWVEGGNADALELEMLVRVRDDEAIWMAVARHPDTSDETLRELAAYGSTKVQDVIVTNQVRVLSCLELLEDLRSNPKADQNVLRRVREFEEEFVRKAVEAEGELEVPAPGPSVRSDIDEMEDFGAQLPRKDDLPLPERRGGEEIDETHFDDEDELEKAKSVYSQILEMNTHEKILAGLKGSREVRGILINSRNRLVLRAVLSSPKLTELEVERFSKSKSVSDEVIRGILENRAWLRRYQVVVNLASNPKTPIREALRLLSRLSKRDLQQISRDRGVQGQVRRVAQQMVQARS